MYETLTCSDCGKKYTNVGAIPNICPDCWDRYYQLIVDGVI